MSQHCCRPWIAGSGDGFGLPFVDYGFILDAMSGHVIIDGNNLLHSMYAHAPVATVGRETMVRIIERWANRHGDDVTLVFDGPPPRGAMLTQMSSRRISVRFSAPQTADDIIIAMVKRTPHPDVVCVVTDDTAIKYEAKLKHCRHTGTVAFIDEVFRPPGTDPPASPTITSEEKPQEQTAEDIDRWTALFDDEPS